MAGMAGVLDSSSISSVQKEVSEGTAAGTSEKLEVKKPAVALETSLVDMLERLRLARFAAALAELGVESTGDLAYLQDSDLEKLGLPLVPRRKLLQAAGGNWRLGSVPPLAPATASSQQQQQHQKEGAATATTATATKATTATTTQQQHQKQPEGQEPATRDEAPAPRQSDLEEQEQDMHEGGDEEDEEESEEEEEEEEQDEEMKVEELEPKQDADAEEGKLVQQVDVGAGGRRNGSIAEITAVEISGERGSAEEGSASAELTQMLANLQEHLQDFAVVNGLASSDQKQFTGRPPRQVLRTMGVLGSGNEFLMKGVRKPGAAVSARLKAAAVAENRDLQEAKEGSSALPYQDWKKLLENFAHVNHVSKAVRESLQGLTRQQALQVMGFTTRLRFVAGSAEGGDATLEVQARIHAALAPASAIPAWLPVVPRGPEDSEALGTPRQAFRSNGGGPPHGVQRSRSRSQRRQVPAGTFRKPAHVAGSGANADGAPNWKRNAETFIQVNHLDERSTQVVRDLSKTQALQVMGLLGRDNSFLIRGARNPSAAVMHRLQKVQEGRGGVEPFTQVPKLIEDFISVNNFDERGTEVLRSLTREAALNVMGFSADNAFVIRGVPNPSAALMQRVMVAQRPSRGSSHR